MRKQKLMTKLFLASLLLLAGLLNSSLLSASALTPVTCPDGIGVGMSPNQTYDQVCAKHMDASKAPPSATGSPAGGTSACDANNGTTACCQSTDPNQCIIKPSTCTKGTTLANCAETATPCNSSQNGSCDLVNNYLNKAINLLAIVVGVVIVISLIYGGILYSSSSGDPQKAAKARGHITSTVIALITFIFLYSFLQFIVPGGVLHK